MTITLTAVPVYDDELPPVNRLTVTVTNTAPNAVPPNTAVTLWRVHADGSEHRVMVSTQPRVIPTTVVVDDYHCPYNVDVTYRVDAPTGSATAYGYLPSEVSWLIPPSDVTLSVPLYAEEVVTFGDRATPTRAVKMTPVGGRSIYKSNGSRDGVKSTLVLRVAEDRVPVFADLFADDLVILVNMIEGDLTWMWAQPDPTYANPVGLALYTKRIVTIALDESADPDLDLTSPWTFGSITALGLTFAELNARYATFTDMSTDTPV